MLTVENDWIEYEAVPARRVAVRGGAACAVRTPVVRARVEGRARAAGPGRRAPLPARVAHDRRAPLRLTRRGRFVLVVMPTLLGLGGAVASTVAWPFV